MQIMLLKIKFEKLFNAVIEHDFCKKLGKVLSLPM